MNRFCIQEKRYHAKFGFLIAISVSVALLGLLSIIVINWRLKLHAFEEAKEKALIILDRNIATHTYFSNQLKPAIFEKIGDLPDKKHFDPRWMSSTYAVREIDKYYQSASKKNYVSGILTPLRR